jgi:hypothetical protein
VYGQVNNTKGGENRTMIKIRELQDGDMDYVRENPLEGAVKNYPKLFPTPPAYTAEYEGKIVGIGGMVVLWEGVGEMWLMLTADSKREGVYGIMVYQAIKNKVDELIKEYNMRRVQCTVRTDFNKARKMVETLGFQLEGLMRSYCPDGADVWMYARIIE